MSQVFSALKCPELAIEIIQSALEDPVLRTVVFTLFYLAFLLGLTRFQTLYYSM